jgi:hypothetical protein
VPPWLLAASQRLSPRPPAAFATTPVGRVRVELAYAPRLLAVALYQADTPPR